jgi:hypothetical protein
MPWWAIAYFGSVIILITGGFLERIEELSRQNFSIKKWTVEFFENFTENVVPCYFYLSFWYQQLADFFGILSPILVFSAVAWHIYSWRKGAVELYEAEPRLNHRQKRNVLLALAIYESPLYIVSIVAVLRNYFR